MNLEIKFFNTLTRKEENFLPINKNHVKIYVCGPTVYDRPHLGNARSIVIYDLLFRFLKSAFLQVTYVRNITDVDDKINQAAKDQKTSIQELTNRIINFFYDDIDELNVLRPNIEPKATKHIKEMIEIIEELLKNNHAYKSENHILFDVKSYKNYGKLSNRNIDEMIAGSRIEVASYKKNDLDFVLWKPADEDDDESSVFESPWGRGRPGWHIECSAMSSKYLGDSFDIHGGGADLQFPHHENEIAQSCCAKPNSTYANFWIHNGFLTVNGEKMSKSLKNFITVRDLLDKGFCGVVIRYFLLSTHYRKPLDFNQKALDDASKMIEKFYSIIDEKNYKDFLESNLNQPSIFLEPLLKHLADDLNFSKVVVFLQEIVKDLKNSDDKNKKIEFIKVLDFLGFLDEKRFLKKSIIDEDYINSQIELRLKFKKEKNFKMADEIRKKLFDEFGVLIEDVGSEKTIWKINNLK